MIPAGVQNGQTEFFRLPTELLAMHNGHVRQVRELPPKILSVVDDAISPKANLSLDRMGIYDIMERRIQFLKCNCGKFDFTPDITAGSDILQVEYVECEFRGSCIYEGQLCQPVVVNGNKVTMAELKVASFIRAGFFDKEICGKLSIAQDTLRSHKKSLQFKLGAERKTQIATQSIKYGI